jgi:GPN-loop GTPase
MGPAGVGKSTFSLALLRHLAAQKRTAHIVNLDPGAEDSIEERHEGWMTDVRDLVTVKDVMTQMHLGK